MTEADREHLRIVVSVALATAPKRVKRAWLDRCHRDHQVAGRELSRSIADAVLRAFEVTSKPDRVSMGLHSRLTEQEASQS